MTDYRNIEDLDSFNNLVETFVKNRKILKTKVKEMKGDVTAKNEEIKRQTEPITKSIEELKDTIKSTSSKGGFFKMFERFSGVSKSQSEIKLTTKSNVGKLGTKGEVDLADLQDGMFRLRNTATGETYETRLDEDLAELLIKPARNIDLDEISNSALVSYYKIMKIAGISARANNNKKLKKSKQAFQNVAPRNKRRSNVAERWIQKIKNHKFYKHLTATQKRLLEEVEVNDDVEANAVFSQILIQMETDYKKLGADEEKQDVDEETKSGDDMDMDSSTDEPPSSNEDSDDDGKGKPPSSNEDSDDDGKGADPRFYIPKKEWKEKGNLRRELKRDATVKKGQSKRQEILKERRKNRRNKEEEDEDEERGPPRRKYKGREYGVDDKTLKEERGSKRRSKLMRTRSARIQGDVGMRRRIQRRQRQRREFEMSEQPRERESGQTYGMDTRNYRRVRQRGFGLMNFDDMIQRFYLLAQSQIGGNISNEITDEMMGLLDHLLVKKVINKGQHKTLFDNYINIV